MKRFAFLLALLFPTTAAFAAVYDASISVTPPTTRTDGTAFPASQVKDYDVFLSCSAATPVLAATRTPPSPLDVAGLFPADGVYSLGVKVRDQQDRLSAMSPCLGVDVSTTANPGVPIVTGVVVGCPNGGTPVVTNPTPTSVKVVCSGP